MKPGTLLRNKKSGELRMIVNPAAAEAILGPDWNKNTKQGKAGDFEIIKGFSSTGEIYR
jgi:hypothetical protein